MAESDFDRLQGLLGTVTDPDEFLAVCNQLRAGVGLPARGHKMTYDFYVAQQSIRRYKETWHRG